MGKQLNAIEQPDLRDYLATLPPDEELQRRADAFAATSEPLAAVRQRPRDIAARIAAIDLAFIDAGAKESAALLAERAALAAEVLALPVRAEALARRYALAELSYLNRARVLVHAEGTDRAAELAPHQDRATLIGRRMTVTESSLRAGAEKFAELDKLREELAGVQAVALPLHRRVDAAQFALGLIDALTSQGYGEGVALAQEGAHEPVAAAYGQRIVRALRAA